MQNQIPYIRNQSRQHIHQNMPPADMLSMVNISVIGNKKNQKNTEKDTDFTVFQRKKTPYIPGYRPTDIRQLTDPDISVKSFPDVLRYIRHYILS